MIRLLREQAFSESQFHPEMEEGLVPPNIQTLNEESLTKRQGIDPIAYAESQSNALFFEDTEHLLFQGTIPLRVSSIWIGEAGLVGYPHLVHIIKTSFDVHRHLAGYHIGIVTMAEGMQPDLNDIGVHIPKVERLQTQFLAIGALPDK